MNESEWIECVDPKPMLEFLRGKTSERKLRLFAVGCCHKYRQLLVPEACEALDVAEKVAEGRASAEERRRVREVAFHVGWVSDPSTVSRRGPAKAAVCDALARSAWDAAIHASWRTSHIGTMQAYGSLETHRSFHEDWSAAKKRQDAALAQSLRCVFGNPFRPVAFASSCLTPTVVAMAQFIYDDRSFDQMATFADELVKSGCADPEILNHCRGPGPHVRGCWALDLVLGRG